MIDDQYMDKEIYPYKQIAVYNWILNKIMAKEELNQFFIDYNTIFYENANDVRMTEICPEFDDNIIKYI